MFLLGFAVWGAIADNVDAVERFAAEHTLTILIILGVIALIIGILATVSSTWKKGIPCAIVLFLSLVLSYNITLIWVNDFVKSAAEVFIIALLVLLPALLFWAFEVLLALLPNLLMFMYAVGKDSNEETSKYDWIGSIVFGIILSVAYCYFIHLFEFQSCIQNLFR